MEKKGITKTKATEIMVSVCVCERVRPKQRKLWCVCVCVCERERESARAGLLGRSESIQIMVTEEGGQGSFVCCWAMSGPLYLHKDEGTRGGMYYI